MARVAPELHRRPAAWVAEFVADEGKLCRRTAQHMAAGEVVGWFQGRMESGPRALGNRSIVCDPRRADMKDILNLKIKRRESFRPFAPSVLQEEAVAGWFEQDDDVPFMMQVYQIRPDKRAQLPAVTHVDGSGRLQTVYRHTNPRYHALISAFAELTGVPMVLNTSFNENEPVVCNPEEALDCFLRTKIGRAARPPPLDVEFAVWALIQPHSGRHMTETVENLVLEHLKRFQAGQERIEPKLDELIVRVVQLELGLAGLRRDFAHADEGGAGMSVRLDRVSERLDRIEKRLELVG